MVTINHGTKNNSNMFSSLSYIKLYYIIIIIIIYKYYIKKENGKSSPPIR
jgi:hypothetical protein